MALSKPTKTAFGPFKIFEYVVAVFSYHVVLHSLPCDKGINNWAKCVVEEPQILPL